jgi:alkanesulfonate monooxygenase SsuD/methylene tetrahydromethanopterin reductase-like flavin-dependent oxidoreductase (luciferase family)
VDLYVSFGPIRDLARLRPRIELLDGLGVDGVLLADHLFFAGDGDRSQSFRTYDPFIVLGTIAGLSDRLRLGTLVANAGLEHPALILRHFCQLAALVGGDRVLAGIGAGWNTEEFDALGIDMPRHADRLDRLEESCRLARAWFDDGLATLDGPHVVARDLPASPPFEQPPQLMLGGGSDRLLELAGRYADHLDLNGSSRRAHLGRKMPLAADSDRRHATTVDDLVDAATRVRAIADEARRPHPTLSVAVSTLTVGEVPDPAVADCPYVLGGDPGAIAATVADRAARIGLGALVLPESPDLAAVVAAIRSTAS